MTRSRQVYFSGKKNSFQLNFHIISFYSVTSPTTISFSMNVHQTTKTKGITRFDISIAPSIIQQYTMEKTPAVVKSICICGFFFSFTAENSPTMSMIVHPGDNELNKSSVFLSKDNPPDCHCTSNTTSYLVL